MNDTWHIFPVDAKKRPLTVNGYHDAVPAYQAFERFGRHSSWAVSCAASGLLVIDIDPRNGGDVTAQRLEAEYSFPPTLAALTGGGGLHLYYRKPEGDRFRKTLGPGVDIKCHGYVVVPPSPHASGGRYAWANALPVAELPDWLLCRVLNLVPDAAVPEPIGEAGTCFLARAFEAAGWLGREIDAGRVCVTCPWAELHSNVGSDTSTILFAPTEAAPLGTFWCSHTSHGPKSLGEVVDALPVAALAGALQQ